MKKLRLYITALVLALAASFTAQAQVLRDANYNAIGRINGNGVVRDAEGHSIGSFDDDGTVPAAQAGAPLRNGLGDIEIIIVFAYSFHGDLGFFRMFFLLYTTDCEEIKT